MANAQKDREHKSGVTRAQSFQGAEGVRARRSGMVHIQANIWRYRRLCYSKNEQYRRGEDGRETRVKEKGKCTDVHR